MAISNVNSNSRPGICTSTTRPTAPYEGQVIYETDTDLVRVWSGSSWVEISSMLTKAPRGVMAYAESTTNYTLTTSAAVSTGMTATFTAVANRYYRITYYEPQAQTSSTQTAQTQLQIRLTNASGTLLNVGIFQQAYSGGVFNGTITAQTVETFSAGSVTVVGCSLTNVAAGTPVLIRSSTQPAFILVEDIGAA